MNPEEEEQDRKAECDFLENGLDKYVFHNSLLKFRALTMPSHRAPARDGHANSVGIPGEGEFCNCNGGNWDLRKVAPDARGNLPAVFDNPSGQSSQRDQ